MVLNAIVIDEKEEQIKELQQKLQSCIPKVNIIKRVNDLEEGIEEILIHNPQIVFLNIDILDYNQIEVLKNISKKDFNLVFITRKHHFAISLFHKYDIRYVLNPFSLADILITVNNITKGVTNQVFSNKVFDDFLTCFKDLQKEKIGLSTIHGEAIILPNNIIRIEEKGNHTTVYFEDKNSLITKTNISGLETILCNHTFFKLHKHHLVNLNNLTDYGSMEGNYLKMNDGFELKLSRRKRLDLIKKMSLILN